ncbi:MAG: dTDP-glucose 4,6-dehydratase, partial [Candidatus Delongbacteria bacterium]|nr:dTDP-glucose 4,6-dehydratase [Candidatus Delongbacteria bacterium]
MIKKILVTGGSGFIGSNFIQYILKIQNDIQIINLDDLTYAGNPENLKNIENDTRYKFIKGNICDEELVSKIFSDNNIDTVINFAAETHVDRSIHDPNIFIKTNVLGTGVLLSSAKKAWGEDFSDKRFLQVSTDEVYGTLPEDDLSVKFTEKTPLQPHSPYSASKTSADCIVQSYYDTYKFPTLITRCSNNYGPYQFPEKLIPLIINNALNDKDLPIYGDGKQIRDWLYVEDHCDAIWTVLEKGKLGEVYNIGGNNEIMNID